ncbi:tRNA-dihydrouridine synthase [Clostridium neuense]|uniref:tRNA-dihydrouridine synthase n=1 Tax=Clostridium neuense TaxID=1728934 RepID=A0ABW8TF51_9CLOT
MANIMESIRIRNVEFKNRIVMAPMVRFGWPSSNGFMGEKLINHYKEAADKEVGFVIMQALSVSEERTGKGRAGVFLNSHADYLGKIAGEYRKNETRLFAQLAYPTTGYGTDDCIDVNRLSKEKLTYIRDLFIKSAKICEKAGLNGIELHGAHRFFLNMITSPISNSRDDKYGCDLNGRITLVKEIVEGIKSCVKDNFIVCYRMGWNKDLDTDISTAKALQSVGVDILHSSSGIKDENEIKIPEDFQYNDVVYIGTQIKKKLNIPVIVVNDIRTICRGNYLVENNLCDFAAYGKPFLADLNFVKKSLENRNYEACFKCKECKWFVDGNKCPSQIKLGRKF